MERSIIKYILIIDNNNDGADIYLFIDILSAGQESREIPCRKTRKLTQWNFYGSFQKNQTESRYILETATARKDFLRVISQLYQQTIIVHFKIVLANC